MQSTDLNLLPAAHALLSEQSVTRAAERLHLSVPATSRVLDRCRLLFGDPLLVRSGRALVITPRGAELLAELRPLVAQLNAVVERPSGFDPASLRRSFVIRANEVVIATLAGALIESVQADAGDVDLRFSIESPDDLDALRSSQADVAIGSYSGLTNDLRSRHLVKERLVGVIRTDHPLAGHRMTVKRFAELGHVVTSRRGIARGPIDEFLHAAGRTRRIAAVVPSFSAALAMCMRSDLTTIAPSRLAELFCAPGGLAVFESPIPLPTVDVRVIWHDRDSADPAHRWLLGCVRRAAENVGIEQHPSV